MLDVGGQDVKVVKVEKGIITDLELNEKCAASCGRYLENMYFVLEISLDKMKNKSMSNTLMGGLGPFDMIGGALVGILTSGTVYLIKKYKFNDWFILIPIIFIPGLLVPIWLSFLLQIPYSVLAINICIGQVIPAFVGVILIKRLRHFS